MCGVIARATAVLLPGGGSDSEFLRRAFQAPLTNLGFEVVGIDPAPEGILATYWSALLEHSANGPVVPVGISIGAAAAIQWAHSQPALAVVAAFPAWTGAAADAPAALAAQHTADSLRTHGIDATIAAMRAETPTWLADDLTRSWRAQWPHLPGYFDEVARFTAPSEALLSELSTPVALVNSTDDGLHPGAVAQHWHDLLPHSRLVTTSLAEIGADAAIIGRCAAKGLVDLLG